MADLPTFLRLLPRSASGQAISSYVSIVTGTRRAGDPEGPERMHILLLDCGRSAILEGKYREILKCVRCAACLNVCPVYQSVGGHAYGWVYSGPIGAVLTPLLVGLPEAAALPDASTLCGACADVCPVKIPLPEFLLELRSDARDQGLKTPGEIAAMKGYAGVMRRAGLLEAIERIAGVLGQFFTKGKGIGGLPYPSPGGRSAATSPHPPSGRSASSGRSGGGDAGERAGEIVPPSFRGVPGPRHRGRGTASRGSVRCSGRRSRRAVYEDVHRRRRVSPPRAGGGGDVRPGGNAARGGCDSPLLPGRRRGGAGDRRGAGPVRAVQSHVGNGSPRGERGGHRRFSHGGGRDRRNGDDRRDERGRENAPAGPDRGRPCVDRARRLAGHRMEEALAAWAADPPRNVSFLSGPSRTGDIEQTLTVGAHGPRKAIALLVG